MDIINYIFIHIYYIDEKKYISISSLFKKKMKHSDVVECHCFGENIRHIQSQRKECMIEIMFLLCPIRCSFLIGESSIVFVV